MDVNIPLLILAILAVVLLFLGITALTAWGDIAEVKARKQRYPSIYSDKIVPPFGKKWREHIIVGLSCFGLTIVIFGLIMGVVALFGLALFGGL